MANSRRDIDDQIQTVFSNRISGRKANIDRSGDVPYYCQHKRAQKVSTWSGRPAPSRNFIDSEIGTVLLSTYIWYARDRCNTPSYL